MSSSGSTRAEVYIQKKFDSALRKIGQVTDRAIGEFTEDVKKMSQALLHDRVGPKSTGKLEGTILHVQNGERDHSVVTTASNTSGYGYGGPQEWGWNPRGTARAQGGARGRSKKQGRVVRGKHFIIRAMFGMIKRWQRGEKWRD